jgi:large subunit ribosomal protein L23
MSILSVFKKNDAVKDTVKEEKALDKSEKEPKRVKKQDEVVKVAPEDLEQYKGVKANILLRPVISEKSSMLNADRKYTFRVMDYSTKQDVRKAVEKKYKVNVERVNMVTVHPKKRMRGAIVGRISGYRKAVVFIKNGQKIDLTK